MHIEDADLDPETAHATAPDSDSGNEKEAAEHAYTLPPHVAKP